MSKNVKMITKWIYLWEKIYNETWEAKNYLVDK